MGRFFEARKATLTEQYAPFGNVELLPTATGEAIPLDDDSVDTVMLSYIFHHMHYADGSGESFPDSSAALVGEFLRVLKPGGTLLFINTGPLPDYVPRPDITIVDTKVPGGRAALARLSELLNDGALKPAVGTTFPLADFAEAYRLNQSGHARGKIVLTMSA